MENADCYVNSLLWVGCSQCRVTCSRTCPHMSLTARKYHCLHAWCWQHGTAKQPQMWWCCLAFKSHCWEDLGREEMLCNFRLLSLQMTLSLPGAGVVQLWCAPSPWAVVWWQLYLGDSLEAVFMALSSLDHVWLSVADLSCPPSRAWERLLEESFQNVEVATPVS